GCRVGDEAARQAAPVVAPVLVLDLDLDVRVGLLELVGALLVDGLLVGVPELVAQEHLAVLGEGGLVGAAAAGEREDGENDGESAHHLIPEKTMAATLRFAIAMNSAISGREARNVAAMSGAHGGAVVGGGGLEAVRATASER